MKYSLHGFRAFGIGFIVASGFLVPSLAGEDPPPNLARRVAAHEAEDEKARNDYTWRQTFVLEEVNDKGMQTGRYSEVRDILFSPDGQRVEQMVGKAADTLTHIKLTDEDFQDLREVQPLLLTTERFFMYETQFKGEETAEGVDCWVLLIRPRQILAGQRLFDGLIWVSKADVAIVKAEGEAVPQIHGLKHENLFPHFTTVRRKVDGHWFPVSTHGDDTLAFRNGAQRERISVRYENYKRFSAETTIRFAQ
jgi:hypothetical protein